MKPWREVGRAPVPGGGEMVLNDRDGEMMLLIDGLELMTSRAHGSEEELARIVCAPLAAKPRPAVLIGGLGMGFTLRAALDVLPPRAEVVVAELVPAVVEWNRGPLAAAHGHALDDPRVTIATEDVAALIARAGRRRPPGFDAILLDVDNGPGDVVFERNRGLYRGSGLTAVHAALRPGGAVSIWSLGRQNDAARLLHLAGFTAETHEVAARERGRGGRRYIYVGRR